MNQDEQREFAEVVAERVAQKLLNAAPTGVVQPGPTPAPVPPAADPQIVERLDRIEMLLGLSPLTTEQE